MEKQYLAIDIGASGGRAVLGSFDNRMVRFHEIHNFSNTPVSFLSHDYWDVLRLLNGIKNSLCKANESGGFASVAIDTWGSDYGLLDAAGILLQNPMQYRDARVSGLAKATDSLFSAELFYEKTGVQPMDINTVYQLYSDCQARPELFSAVKTLLMIPDLFQYCLTGVRVVERSIANTTQLVDWKTQTWSNEILDCFHIPKTIFPEIIPSGTVIGTIHPSIQTAWSLPAANVTAVCGHDTQCALTAIPTQEEDFIFISCGTWAIFGTELAEPIVNAQTRGCGMTNGCGFQGKTSLTQKITGLWLIQESRRWMATHGESYSYAQLEQLAMNAEPFTSLIDVDDPRFLPLGDIPSRIRDFCKETDQTIPISVGAMTRCIYESLALRFAKALKDVCACTGKTYRKIHIVGGGVKDQLLCQMTADACGLPVVAGPTEATVFGNLAIQMIADGALSGLKEARSLVEQSSTLRTFHPQSDWKAPFARFQQLIG